MLYDVAKNRSGLHIIGVIRTKRSGSRFSEDVVPDRIREPFVNVGRVLGIDARLVLSVVEVGESTENFPVAAVGGQDDGTVGLCLEFFEEFRIVDLCYPGAAYALRSAAAEPNGFGDNLSEMQVEVLEDFSALLGRFLREGFVYVFSDDLYSVAHNASS